MILDTQRFAELSTGSAQRVLCRCDDCGAEKMVVRQALTRGGNAYRLCQRCNARTIGSIAGSQPRSPQYRQNISLAHRGRDRRTYFLTRPEALRHGKANPRFNPDRNMVTRRERARREAYRLIHSTLRRLGIKKNTKTETLLGYSKEELMAHLERQFLPGMSWKNRGAWHVDHIRPVAKLVAEGITDPAIISALSNLRPLWAPDNLARRFI